MRIEITQNGSLLETRDLEDGSYSIGRSSSSAIPLSSPQISKNHALLVIKGGRAAIIDVGSANGVFVNGILVRKQRVDIGDEIFIGPFRLRVVSQINIPKGTAHLGNILSGDRGLAHKLKLVDYPEQAPQAYRATDQLVKFIDDRILLPFFALIKKIDWRVMMGLIVGGALVIAVSLSAWPFLNWGKNVLVAEATARGHAILRQCVRDNYRVLSKTNDFTRLTVEAVEREPGVIEATIADPTARTILSPSKLYNKSISDLYALRAIEKIEKEEGAQEITVERDDGTFILAQPIYAYSQESRTLLAVAMLEFQIPDNIHSTFTPLAEMILLAILLGLIAYFLLLKMFSFPVTRMLDQIDAALKGEAVSITSEIKFPEFEMLAQNLTFAMSRLRAGNGTAIQPSGSHEDEQDELIQNATVAFDNGTADALLLLDTDKKIRFVGRIAEELLSMRSQYAIGQNISEACRDQSFSGTAIDLCERVIQSLGESQNSALEINGTSRQVTGVALRNSDAAIRFILITVKMNG